MAAYGGFALAAVQEYFNGKTVKAMLVTSAYVQNVDTHAVYDDVSASEISGGSYPAGGVAVQNLTTSYDPATNLAHVTCDDIAFTGLDSADVAGVIFYVDTGSGATAKLLGYDQYVTPVDATSASLVHQVSADGIFTLLVQE